MNTEALTREFVFQLQLDASTVGRKEEFVSEINELIKNGGGLYKRTTEGKDNKGLYINIHTKSTNPTHFWNIVKSALKQHPKLAKAAIVIMEGKNTWSDYLLMHHYDVSQKLDKFPD